MKILAEIETDTHTVLDLAVLNDILQEIKDIQQQLKKKNIDRIAVNMKEAARLLGCNYTHIKQLFHEGKLKGRQEGRGSNIFIEYQSILDFMKATPKRKQIGEEIPTHYEEITEPSNEEFLDLHSRLSKRQKRA